MNKLARVFVWTVLTFLVALPVFAGTLTIPFTFSPSTTIFSSQVNSNFTAIATVINGGLDHTNLTSTAGITLSQLNLNPGGQAFNKTTIGATTWCSGLTTDNVPTVAMVAGGGLQFGPGASGALDVRLIRSAANTLQLNNNTAGAATLDMHAGAITNLSTLGFSAGTISGLTSLSVTQGFTAGTNGGTGGTVILNGSTSGSATIGVPAVAGATTFNLPVGNGAAGNYLKGDGAGNLSYSNPTPRFTSADQTITAAGALTLPHGLGVVPARIYVALVNTIAQSNYTVGDVTTQIQAGPQASNQGCALKADATNVYVQYGGATNTFEVINWTTGVSNPITNADWKLRVYAEP